MALALTLMLAVSFVACNNKSAELEIGGFSAAKLAADVYYVEGVELESDSGENISAAEGARMVRNRYPEASSALTPGARAMKLAPSFLVRGNSLPVGVGWRAAFGQSTSWPVEL